MTKEEVQLYYQIGMMGRKDLYFSPDARSGLEMIMIRMLAFKPTEISEGVKKKQVTKSLEKPNQNPTQNESSGETWQDMINTMELVGLVNELARNCILKSQDKDKIELSLKPSCDFLLKENLKVRLEKVIKEKLGSDIKLIINIEESDTESPSEADARIKKDKQNVAKEAVKNDPDVKSLLDTFDATIDQDSIQPQ